MDTVRVLGTCIVEKRLLAGVALLGTVSSSVADWCPRAVHVTMRRLPVVLELVETGPGQGTLCPMTLPAPGETLAYDVSGWVRCGGGPGFSLAEYALVLTTVDEDGSAWYARYTAHPKNEKWQDVLARIHRATDEGSV